MQRQKVVLGTNIGFKIILALVITSGVALALSGATSGLEILNTFFYFTIQSNLILFAAMVYGAIRLLRGRAEGKIAAIIRNGSTLWILLTGLVYHFMLSGAAIAQGRFGYLSISLHYVSPVMAILNWILFEEKGRSRYLHVSFWVAYPLLYVGVSELRLLIDGFYPYWFLNPVAPYPEGTGSVWLMLAIVGALVVIFGLIGTLICFLDRLMGRKTLRPSR